jgi:hypothetical protein
MRQKLASYAGVALSLAIGSRASGNAHAVPFGVAFKLLRTISVSECISGGVGTF